MTTLVNTKSLRAGLNSLRERAQDIGCVELWRERNLCGGFAFSEEEAFLTWVARDHGVDIADMGSVTHVMPGTPLFVEHVSAGKVCEHYLIHSGMDAKAWFVISLHCGHVHWHTTVTKQSLAA